MRTRISLWLSGWLALQAIACTGAATVAPAPAAAVTGEVGRPAEPDPDPGPPVDAGQACSDRNPLKNLYFGDLHVHTVWSLDAYTAATRAGPRDAYAFARGRGSVRIAGGAPEPGPEVRIDRPLDFAAVTEHSEYLGVVGTCTDDGGGLKEQEDLAYCRALRDQGSTGQTLERYAGLFQLLGDDPKPPIVCRGSDARRDRCAAQERTVWKELQAAANDAYDRCGFTTFKAYEWSGQEGSANFHRNVIFAGDRVPDTPFDFLDYPKAMDLWQALSRECRSAEGCDVLTIPHNSNASMGRMWDTWQDPAAVPYMRRYQTLAELFQHKGSSECLTEASVGDPGCEFELIRESFFTQIFGIPTKLPQDVERGYVRNALAQGLSYAAQRRVNPLELGVLGSTDTHNATPGNVREASWPGHVGGGDWKPAARLEMDGLNPGGLTAVWAEQNTRESIFAALKRREVYATSGPRVAVRFYVVPDLKEAAAAQRLCEDPSFPQGVADAGGVPMGGTFTAKAPPWLIVHALKDETPLAQIDVVKLSSDAGGRAAVAVKSFPLQEASATRACVTWRDEDFDPSRPTLYYVRVIEQPTARWSHHACRSDPKIDPALCPPEIRDARIQERAWSSPVFSR